MLVSERAAATGLIGVHPKYRTKRLWVQPVKRKSGNSGDKIAVRPRLKTIQSSNLDKLIGYGQVYMDGTATRSTEVEALSHMRPMPTLSPLHREIALLERIGRDPNYAPDHPVNNRPARPLYGSALWAWIGRQPGITMGAKEVEAWLREIEHICQVRAEMGEDNL